MGFFAKERVRDVATVELSHGHHVEPRDEQPHPAGHEIRVQLRMGRHDAGLVACWVEMIHDHPHN